MDNYKLRSLPEFDAPPLHEVALAVQFERLAGLSPADYHFFKAEFNQEFPRLSTHPVINPQFERVGAKPAGRRIELMAGVELPRIWLVNGSDDELVQIQPDRFVRNWRKRDHKPYPRYRDHLRPVFERDYNKFINTVRENQLGEIVPNQCEISYFNIITLQSPENNNLNVAAKVLSFFKELDNPGLFQAEGFSFKTARVITSEDDQFLGRLHIEVSSIVESPGLQLNLVVRGLPKSPKATHIMDFMDMGRELIVNTFTSITTEEMHTNWSRTS